MEDQFDIKPYEGAGKIRFGMSPEDVNISLGPPEDTDINMFNEIKESRQDGGLNTVYSQKDRRLVEIGFSPNILGLTFKDTPVFVGRPLKVYKDFLKEDNEPYESVGFIVLFKIGVTLTGFHDNSPDDRAVTLFQKGRWDPYKTDLKPYRRR